MASSVRAAQVKLAIAIVLDIADFFIGRIPGFGTGFDVILTAISFAMFGWKGLAQGFEILDFTDQLDGFVPVLTLLAFAELREARKAAGDASAS